MPGNAPSISKEQRVRLFPLPEVVPFPHTLLPLQVIEPQYRQLTEAALNDDRQLVIVQLHDGDGSAARAPTLDGRPGLCAIGCLSTIGQVRRLAGGRYSLVLRCEARIRLLAEENSDQLYRCARGVILHDCQSANGCSWRRLQRIAIISRMRQLLPRPDRIVERFLDFLSGPCAAGVFTDILAHTAPLAPRIKQQLLSQVDVDRRLRILRAALHDDDAADAVPVAWEFPPRFTGN